MNDQDDQDDQEFDEPRERRTEGVRIIGAQEAAAAAGRPDVVRRRRGAEKRYGDRPDAPAASEDLPRITISTTEHDDGAGSGSGVAEPAARPAGDPGAEPQWRTEDRAAGGRDSYGHARVVSEDPGAGSDDSLDLDDVAGDASEAAPEPPAPAPESSGPEPDPMRSPAASHESQQFEPDQHESQQHEPEQFEPDQHEPDQYEPDQYEAAASGFAPDELGSTVAEPSDEPGRGAAAAPAATSADRSSEWQPTDATGWSDEPVAAASSSIWEPEPLPWESDAPGATPVPSWPETPAPPLDTPGTLESGPSAFGDEGDDSFILPHWTEPPTGQVPKVVIDEEPDPDAVASYGTQPRWRDEGERSSVADFDDLVDQGPGLGALARHAIEDEHGDDDFFANGPSTEGGFAAIDDDTGFIDEDDLYDDELYDDDRSAPPSRSRGSTPRRSGRDGAPPTGTGGGDRSLPVAVGVGLALVGIGLLCFWAGPLPTALLATVVVTLCGAEYFSAVRSAGHNPASLLGIVAVAGVMFATFAAGLAAYPVVLGLLVITGLLWFLWVAPGEGAMANLGLTLLGVLWVGVLGSFSTLFLGLGRSVEAASADITSNPGIGVLIAAVIASVTHDVGAYFTGKYLGRTPLSAASPNKTQEGLAGGVIVSIVVTFVLVGLIGISPIGDDLARAFIFAVLCALVAPLGDLAESFIKRDLGIKDMGSVLPGHGGVLDRFDALLFVLPTAYFVTVLFEIWTVGAG